MATLPNAETEPVTSAPIAASRASRLVPALLIVMLAGIAGAFWKLNGAQVFSEMLASAWALCF